MNNPITTSCSQIDLEKQIVFRANRLIRVRNVRCFRSILWVLALLIVCFDRSRYREYPPQVSV
jgi:hypothetical protein